MLIRSSLSISDRWLRAFTYTLLAIHKPLLICLLVAGCFTGSSASAVGAQVPQPADTLIIRSFQKEHLDPYLQDEAYRYDREFRPQAPSLWQRFKQWLFERLIQALGDENTSTFLRWIMYILCGAVILYVILKLTNTSIRGLIYGQSERNRMAFTESEENIHELDFDKLIKEAEASREYNRAIRLYYLKMLKKLTDKGFIDWKINKTNHDYIQEMSSTDLAPSFRRITLLFEYFCYGDFKMNDLDFEEARTQFNTFEAQVQQKTISKTGKVANLS
jgi:hypothetical protein